MHQSLDSSSFLCVDGNTPPHTPARTRAHTAAHFTAVSDKDLLMALSFCFFPLLQSQQESWFVQGMGGGGVRGWEGNKKSSNFLENFSFQLRAQITLPSPWNCPSPIRLCVTFLASSELGFSLPPRNTRYLSLH